MLYPWHNAGRVCCNPFFFARCGELHKLWPFGARPFFLFFASSICS